MRTEVGNVSKKVSHLAVAFFNLIILTCSLLLAFMEEVSFLKLWFNCSVSSDVAGSNSSNVFFKLSSRLITLLLKTKATILEKWVGNIIAKTYKILILSIGQEWFLAILSVKVVCCLIKNIKM